MYEVGVVLSIYLSQLSQVSVKNKLIISSCCCSVYFACIKYGHIKKLREG